MRNTAAVMVHTNQVAALAPARGITADELHADQRARGVYLAVTERDVVMSKLTSGRTTRNWVWYRLRRAGEASRGLTTVIREMVEAFNAGAAESELMRFEQLLSAIRKELYTGNAHRTLDELDLLEDECEAAENHVNLRGRIEGWTEQRHLDAAEKCRRESCIELERAALHERLARQMARDSAK